MKYAVILYDGMADYPVPVLDGKTPMELAKKPNFDALAKKAPNEYWLGDGVHPSAKGHEFIKNQWLKAFKAI
jgi:2,3-bisphosphoglycerate-independent phosphoglycerate mutase